MSKRVVSPRPEGEGWEWIEEFGGGEWQRLPQKPPDTVRSVLQSVLYGPTYQGPQGTRSTTGTWINYPGL